MRQLVKPGTVILRDSEWLRGEKIGTEGSYLYRPTDERMCCLGILGLACGHTKEEMEWVVGPSSLADNTSMDFLQGLYLQMDEGVPDDFGVMGVNDDTELSDVRRFEILRNRFAKVGITLIFDKDA